MSLTNPNKIITEERLADFYQQILPYLGGMPDILANKFARGDVYSTDEKMIGRWIDGKPVYQKTIVSNWGSQQTLTTNTWTDLNLSGMPLNIDTIVNSELLFNGPSKSNFLFNISYSVNSNGINYYTTIQYNYVQLRLTIQYTKTTDSSVEIGLDTDYSTTEKIVGTWIDGKPIYQKTVNFGALPNNTAKNVPHGITNLGDVVDLQAIATHTGGTRILLPNPTSTNICAFYVNETDLTVNPNGNYANYTKCYVTLRYTKTS